MIGRCDSQLGTAGCKDRSPERCTKEFLDCKGDQERGDIACKKTCGLCGKEFEAKPRCLRWNDRSDIQHSDCLLNITSTPVPFIKEPPQLCMVNGTGYSGNRAHKQVLETHSVRFCDETCGFMENCNAWSYQFTGLDPYNRDTGYCYFWETVDSSFEDEEWVSGCLLDTAETTTAINSPTSTVPTTTVATANELPAAPCQYNERHYVGLKSHGYFSFLESPRACDERCRRDPRCQLWEFKISPSHSTDYKLCTLWNDATGAMLIENPNFVAGCLPDDILTSTEISTDPTTTTTLPPENELPAAPCQHNDLTYKGIGSDYDGKFMESPRECYERCVGDPRCQLWVFCVDPDDAAYKMCGWWNNATGVTLVDVDGQFGYVVGCLPNGNLTTTEPSTNSPTTTTLAPTTEPEAAQCQIHGRLYSTIGRYHNIFDSTPKSCEYICREGESKDLCKNWSYDNNPDSAYYKTCYIIFGDVGVVDRKGWISGCLPGETSNLPG